jgi:RNA polymerase sigma-70 factor (ECF subfamily)
LHVFGHRRVYTYVIALELPSVTIRLAKAGDAGAFERLVREHERLVLGTAIRLVNGGRADAEDAAQQVFLRVYQHLDRYQDEGNFSHWLYRITVNVCRDMNRKSRLRNFVVLEETPSHAVPADESLVAEQRRRLVAEALRELPEKERAAIVLRDIRGLETTEVAAILGSSDATVRSQISSGRRKIKEIIERRMR